MMSLTHDQARQQLHAWTSNPALLGHARSVEVVMRAAAAKYGERRRRGLGHHWPAP